MPVLMQLQLELKPALHVMMHAENRLGKHWERKCKKVM